jgi:hypothetical protein
VGGDDVGPAVVVGAASLAGSSSWFKNQVRKTTTTALTAATVAA